MRQILLSITFSLIAANLYAACEVAGCNGEICRAAGDNKFIFSTCLWKAEYQCYASYGKCAEDANGVCGWQQTPELQECIEHAETEVANTDRFSD